ncbi:MAG: large subunit ribosomal protein L23 [Nitrospinales bacterium]|jgi:large subunit ribosomal protein L23|nr:50S ribosomal protein L23 [Nitrospinaceae bacterium]HCG73091.1 50S ribosomal protein L23 [Nitrospina sp.]|tara:strand:- start:51 stop:338 length:288 start_codon:yes stop_codon:yes gene_type:complete
MDMYKIVKKPLVTEKGTVMLSEGNRVTFKVHLDANKIEIREAVQKIFSVTVLQVNTQVVRGKRKRFGKAMGQTKSWKKAMVQLKEGDKIEIFEGV